MSNTEYQNQEQFPLQLKLYDDCFHRTIIALERLEAFLELQRGGQNSFLTTAVKSTRDLYDDSKVIPTPESYSQQVDIQAATLLYQVKGIKDEKLYRESARYYLQDLLSWYGGRDEQIPFDMVESFFVPISAIIYRQVTKMSEVNSVTEQYVTHIFTIDELSDIQKRNAVMNGFNQWLVAQDVYQKELQEYQETHVGVEYTSHKRGTPLDGYKRLFTALTTLYTDALPARILCKSVADLLPEIASDCPTINEENVQRIITENHNALTNSNERKNGEGNYDKQRSQPSCQCCEKNEADTTDSIESKQEQISVSNHMKDNVVVENNTSLSNDETSESSTENKNGCLLSKLMKLLFF